MRYILLFFLLFLSFSCSAKCLINNDKTSVCRYAKGDSWCRDKQPEMPYAYSDSCLSSINEKIDIEINYLYLFFDIIVGKKGNISMYLLWIILFLLLVKLKKYLFTKKPPRKKNTMKQSLGVIIIPPNKRGLVYKKKGKYRSDEVKISQNNEIGYQAKLLPEGKHLYYWKWKYDVEIVSPIIISHDEIALVESKIGKKISNNTSLGKLLDCNDFQDVKKFIDNGGEKGKQIDVLTEGEYFINREAFTVITKNNSEEYGVTKKNISKITINNKELGVVTVINGDGCKPDELNFLDKKTHNSYQNPQLFYDNGGKKGLQEELITDSGEYVINPWFANIKKIPFTYIPTSTVGVIVSDTGKLPTNNHGIVEVGYKGIWSESLSTGNHYINTETKIVYIVPIMEITLEWSPENEKASDENYDSNLFPVTATTKDGFDIQLGISQTIRIKENEAPKLISKLSSYGKIKNDRDYEKKSNRKYSTIKNLISKRIKSLVESRFMDIVNIHTALEFIDKKNDIQIIAARKIQDELNQYGVESKDISIRILDFPIEIKNILKTKATKEGRIEEEKIKSEIKKISIDGDLQEMRELINILGKDEYMTLRRLEEFVKLKLPNSGLLGDNRISELIISQFSGESGLLLDNASGVDKEKLESLMKNFNNPDFSPSEKIPPNINMEEDNEKNIKEVSSIDIDNIKS